MNIHSRSVSAIKAIIIAMTYIKAFSSRIVLFKLQAIKGYLINRELMILDASFQMSETNVAI